jgi:hypothetical protein
MSSGLPHASNCAAAAQFRPVGRSVISLCRIDFRVAARIRAQCVSAEVGFTPNLYIAVGTLPR